MFTISLVLLFLIKLRRSPTNFIQHLKSCYGTEGVKLYRKLEECEKKKIKTDLDIKFLETCKCQNIIPKFLRFKLHKKSLHNSRFYNGWQHKLLIREIQEKRKLSRGHVDKLLSIRDATRAFFSPFMHLIIKRRIKSTMSTFNDVTSRTHSRKLTSLGIDASLNPCNPDSVIHNYSSVSLPPRLKILLAFGLDFCLPVFKLDFVKYFVHFERICLSVSSLQCSDKAGFIRDLKQIVNKYFYNFKSYKKNSAIVKHDDISCLKNFAKNDQIIVSKPDKGKGVVIIDKDKYIDSLQLLISDVTKFVEITIPIEKFTVKIEDKLNNFLRKIKNIGIFTQDIISKLYVSGSNPGVLYGLPKIHKIDFKDKYQFRPILAAYNTPSFNLAKFLYLS